MLRITDVLLLKRNFYTTLDYSELKNRLKRRIGVNFKLGFVSSEAISLYDIKDSYTENGMDRVPFCKVEVRNEKAKDGRIRIRFSVATFVLVVIALVPVTFMFIFYFANAPIPFYYLLGLYPVLYFVLQVGVANQMNKFQLDLRQLEIETIG